MVPRPVPCRHHLRIQEDMSLSIVGDPVLERILATLHARSQQQEAIVRDYYAQWVQAAPQSDTGIDAFLRDKVVASFLSDKLVALDREKAEFCYLLCRVTGARRIVEAGTSYGVSTLYLAAAVRDNVLDAGGDGVVIGTEYEPQKARAARAHFEEAGLSHLVDLREGDLRETLKLIDGPIDFMLLDIWMPMARPALELVARHLRPGAIVICDNTARYRSDYADYFAFLDDPDTGFRTVTLPFDGGLELSVRC
jgi:predicted O-methyltransferase YrrM